MSKQELEIVIAPTGEIQINVQGMKGSKCVDLTKSLEEALGHVVQRTLKPEYYESGISIETQPNRQSGNLY